MGKYSAVLKGLAAEIRFEGSFRERVDALKTEFGTAYATSAQLAEAYAELRVEKSKIEAELKKVHVRIAAVEETMWGRFEDEGISSLKLTSGNTIRVQPEPHAQVQDRERLAQWVREQGLERLLALPWSTVNSLSKERLLAGDPIPDGVELKIRTTTVFSAK